MSIDQLVHDGALFIINDSGGKDSQAMKILLARIIPHHQLVIVHAHLPEVEWEGTIEHIKRYSFGIEVFEVRARKTFFEMVEHRKRWPSASTRQCTSDLKRGPIEKKVRSISKERGNKLIVNCMGLRSEESPSRSKKQSLKLNTKNSKAGRVWYDWLPIQTLSTEEVFLIISDAQQEPHWVYSSGMTRKSCCFCIMSSKQDLKTAAGLKPQLFKRYLDKERQLDHTLLMPGKTRKFLDQVIQS
jgi:3'-phosphoadenosine 5'-phosphosulfate sulfotransferase (PAPS reductase)/FAD synthetase